MALYNEKSASKIVKINNKREKFRFIYNIYFSSEEFNQIEYDHRSLGLHIAFFAQHYQKPKATCLMDIFVTVCVMMSFKAFSRVMMAFMMSL